MPDCADLTGFCTKWNEKEFTWCKNPGQVTPPLRLNAGL